MNTSRAWSLLLPMAMTACAPDEPRSPIRPDDPGPVIETGALPCGTEPPRIDQVSVIGNTDDEGPMLVFVMMASDGDGALHYATLRVWHDLEVDGAVDVAGEPTWTVDMDILNAESMAPNLPEVCEVRGGFPMSIGMRVEPEYGMPFGAPVELAVTLVDADGWESAPVIVDGCVDTAEGEPGCA